MFMWYAPIRISFVDPSAVETNFSRVRFKGDEERAKITYQGFSHLLLKISLRGSHFARLGWPAHVDVREIKIYPTAQTAVHMVNRSE